MFNPIGHVVSIKRCSFHASWKNFLQQAGYPKKSPIALVSPLSLYSLILVVSSLFPMAIIAMLGVEGLASLEYPEAPKNLCNSRLDIPEASTVLMNASISVKETAMSALRLRLRLTDSISSVGIRPRQF